MMNPRKVAVIGCGFVGASIAFALMQKGLFSEMVLIDANHAKAEGEAMDLSHGLPYTASMDIYAGDYKDVADCGLIIITAGANQKPGETRLDLIEKNVGILKSIVPQITVIRWRESVAPVRFWIRRDSNIRLADIWMWTAAAFMPLSSVSMATANFRCGAGRMCPESI